MSSERPDKKLIFSSLWIFVTLNYLYCDLMGLMDANLLKQYLTGTVNGIEMKEGFFLGAALLMEIPIAMVLLSVILKYKANRWANIIAGTLKTIVMLLTLFVGNPTQYYMFFAIIEISCTSFIVIYAWKWIENKNRLTNKIVI